MPIRTVTSSGVSRRKFLIGAGALSIACAPRPAQSFPSCAREFDPVTLPPYGNGTLAPGIRSRMVFNINGLSMHVLEAGFDEPDRPLVLLLHGFPDLCYCWRKIMVPLAGAGYPAPVWGDLVCVKPKPSPMSQPGGGFFQRRAG